MKQKITKKKSGKKSFLLLVAAAFVLPVWGGQVDENTARQVATQTLSRSATEHETQLRTQAVPQKTVQLLYKSSSENTNASMRSSQTNEMVHFYVFGAENNEGFVIVAGDDRVTPVLGYSETNGFSVDNMPPNLKWWLGEYAKQIEFAIENDIEATEEVAMKWAEYFGNNSNGKEE